MIADAVYNYLNSIICVGGGNCKVLSSCGKSEVAL